MDVLQVFSLLDRKSLEGAWFQLTYPGGAVVGEEFGKPARIRFLGPDSERWRQAELELNLVYYGRAIREGRKELSREETFERNLKLMAAVAVEWENVTDPPEPITEEGVCRVLRHPRAYYPAKDFVGDRDNFGVPTSDSAYQKADAEHYVLTPELSDPGPAAEAEVEKKHSGGAPGDSDSSSGQLTVQTAYKN